MALDLLCRGVNAPHPQRARKVQGGVFMKALIGGAASVAALGGALLLANTRSMSPAGQAQLTPAQTVASTSALAQTGPTYVDCGPGRVAMFRPVAPGQTFSQVECAVAPGAMAQGFVEPSAMTAGL